MGGYSGESVISLQSGKVVYENLCRDKYDPYQVCISKKNWTVNINGNKYLINKKDFSVKINNNHLKFDCIFNAIHGTPGEDGILQSYFDLINIPYTGCNFHHSNITFNKGYCLALVKHFGINTSKSIFLNKNQKFCKKYILKEIGMPCFIKPNKSGSSLGINKIHDEKEFDNALEIAFEVDEEILVESFLCGKEISVGVFSFDKKNITVLPITEIISQNEFFDFESKYSGKSQEITPANISSDVENKVRVMAEKVYRILNLSGMSRSEYIIVDEEPFFLEINTVPGLCKESILPKQLKKHGISLSDFFHNLIDMSLRKIK